jgi:quinoprotein glucose dehydrogenase
METPASDLDGEAAWPVQRLPMMPPPFARQVFAENNISRITDSSYAFVKARFDQGLRTGRQFIPPSTEGTVIFPGFDGGGEWGGAAVDPETGILYVNGNEMPWILTMVDLRHGRTPGARLYAFNCAVCHGAEREGDPQGIFPALTAIGDTMSSEEIARQIRNGKGIMPSFGHLTDDEIGQVTAFLLDQEEGGAQDAGIEALRYPYGHTGYNRFLDPDGYPAVEPPWGTLNAIDLNRGEILWQVPLGEFPELTARGIPKTGTENYGGPVVTAGGLIFIGASKDEFFRAFDKKTGEELWKAKLPAGGYATPATYMLDGKQYVVIAAGGGKMGTRSGDAYVAYALPD